MSKIEEAINDFDNFPLSETQQELVNYLRDNSVKVADDLGIDS